MGVINIDPCTWVDEIFDSLNDPRREYYLTTGLQAIDKLSVYSIILNSTEDADNIYGHMVSENSILVDTEDITSYIAIVVELVADLIGITDLEDDDDIVITGFEIEDESEAFQKMNSGFEDDPKIILEEVLTSALEYAIIVLTGDRKEVDQNVLCL